MVLRRLPRGARVPVPVCTVAVALLWAAVGERASEGLPVWWWPVPLVLGWAGVLLAGADLIARRLPDALTLPAYPVVAVLLGVAAAGAGTTEALARAAASRRIELMRKGGPARLLGYRDVPHGPAMLAAAWLVVLHPPV